MITSTPFPHITGVILGGGLSRRMGCDKRRLQWEGKPFLDKVSGVMSCLFEEVLVVTAEEDYDCSHLAVRLVTDKVPHKGSLGGLYTGLVEAKNELIFVVACDMPLLKIKSISRLCSLPHNEATVVKLSTGLQPLHACYSKSCISYVEKMIHEGDLKIQNLYSQKGLKVEIIQENLFDDIDPYRESFMNVNTPADFEFVRKRSSQSLFPH